MKDFKNRLLSLIDNGASQAKTLIESFNNVVNSFDMDAQIEYFNERKNELIKRGNDLFGDFADLLKQVKDNITDFTVTVSFDEASGEKLSYDVKNGKLVVEVSYEDETTEKSSKTSVLIPNNCDLENITVNYNNNLKTATITIPKKVVEPTEEKATPTNKPKKNAKKKKATKKVTEEEPTTEDEKTLKHVSNKLAQKLSQNGKKYADMLKRGADGRFVRRTPKSN